MPALNERSERVWRWLIGLALVAFAGLAFYARQRGIHWGGDDADYALLARGLREFRYHDVFQVGAPPHTTYPPFYPLLLSLWGGAFGDGVSTLTALNVLLMLAALGVSAHLIGVHGSTRLAAAALLVLVVNPHMLEYGGRLLAEAPMMFLGASAVWLADRRPGRRGSALAIACAVLCAMTRTAGVAFIAGIGAYWLLKRRFAAAAALAGVTAVVLGAWVLWISQETAAAGTVYTSRLAAYQVEGVPLWRSLSESMATKALSVLGRQMPDALALPAIPGTRLDNLAWAPLSLGAVAVGVWTIGRRVPVLGLVFLAYLGVLLVWPFSGTRLLIPIIPVLSLAAIVGAGRLGGAMSPRLGRGLGIAVAGVLFLGGAWRSPPVLTCDGSVFSTTPGCIRASETGLGRAIAHLRDHAPSDAVVMVRRGEISYFYTGLLTVPWPTIPEAEGTPADTVLARTGVDYILASHAYVGRMVGLSILLDGACERLAVELHEPPHTLLLSVHPSAPALERNACAEIRRDFPVAADR